MKELKVEITLTFNQVERWCNVNGYTLARKSVAIPRKQIRDRGINGILKNIHNYTGVSKKDIIINTRRREIVESRQLAHAIAKKHLTYSLAYIGREIGGKDHATVLNSTKAVNNLIKTNRGYRDKFSELIGLYALDSE